MQEIFNFRRFILLIRRIVSERGVKILGGFLFILVCMLSFMYTGYIKPSIYHQSRLMFLFFGLMLGPIIHIWVISSELQNNSMGISYLMLPSSIFEKWLINMIFGISLYYLVFVFSFKLFDTLFVAGIHKEYDSTGIASLINKLTVLNFDDLYYYLPLILGIIISLSILIGSLHFKRNSLVYSLVCVLVLFIITIVFHYFIINIFLDGNIAFNGNSLIPFQGVTVTYNSNFLKEYQIKSNYSLLDVIFTIGIPAICILSITYYLALKEKEI